MAYQTFKGNPENKLLYTINNLVGGINTEFSDDVSSDVEFKSIVNFDMDRLGSLNKRKGFGELSAVSQIFNDFLTEDELPLLKTRTKDNHNPETENDNLVYAKLIKNDNNCFRNLSAFSGEKAYRKYQEMYGFQNNEFKLLLITVRYGVSKAWVYTCRLPEIVINGDDTIDTAEMEVNVIDLPVEMIWDRNMINIDTIEFYDKIYFTNNKSGLICFDRSTDSFSYKGVPNSSNTAYKPTALEVSKIGFNMLGTNPLTYVNVQESSVDSIQGMYLTTVNGIPLLDIPKGEPFLVNIFYTGSGNNFEVTVKELNNQIDSTIELQPALSRTGLRVYKIIFNVQPTSEVEIKVAKVGSAISPYYDYFQLKSVDQNAKPVSQLNVGEYKICEIYNRAIYYKDDTIWYSEVNNFDYIPNSNFITLPIEPTDKITKIIYFEKSYIVFTKQRIYKIVGELGSESFEISPVNLSIGCHAGDTVVPIDNSLYFASPRGLYALKSNAFVEGVGNVKEIDLKVKTLTSDFTLYNDDLANPAIRFNGISEKAIALRYKNKYMLFYNSSYENGDYAAENNLDVLVYQYDMQNYTTYSFKEKPTFIFKVDDAIEALCSVYNKTLFVDEELLLAYDFTNIEGGVIEDLSDNGYDAVPKGSASVLKSDGVGFNGTNSYMRLGTIGSNVIEPNGFTLDMEYNLKSYQDGDVLVRLGSTAKAIVETESSGSISSDNNDYMLRIDYNMILLPTDKISVSYTVTLTRKSQDSNYCEGNYRLNAYYSGTLINKNFSATFNGSNSLVIDSGVLSLNRNDVNFGYQDFWYIDCHFTKYITTSYSYYDKGPNTSGSPQLNLAYKSGVTWLKVGIPWAAVAYDGYTRVTVTNPYIRNTANLSNPSRSLKIYVNGTALDFTVPSITSHGNHAASGSKYVDIYYNADSKSVELYGIYYANATLGGTKYASITSDKTSISLPKNKLVEGTTTDTITSSSESDFVYIGFDYVDPEHVFTNNYAFKVSIEDNCIYTDIGIPHGEYSGYIFKTYPLDNLLGEHKLSISVNTNIFNCYFDNELIMSTTTPDIPKLIDTSVIRDLNFIGCDENMEHMPEFDLHKIDFGFMKYDLKEGYGNVIYDSYKGIQNTLNNCTWLFENGIFFSGIDEYVEIPKFVGPVYFENGFQISFTGKFELRETPMTILSFSSKEYTSGKKNAIGFEVENGTFRFYTNTISGKSARIQTNSIDYTKLQDYRIDCIDNLSGYTITLYCNNNIVKTEEFGYGIISNDIGEFNYIGKPTSSNDRLYGMLDELTVTTFANKTPLNELRTALYEFDTTFSDFGREIDVELISKGLNLQYPLHLKKLKNIFVKVKGGFSYNEFVFKLYGDGYLVNDPYKYHCYVDDLGHIVYDYIEDKELRIDESVSLLGNMRLNNTKLGEGTYQTKKLMIPSKAKNFTVHISGESKDDMSIESFGFVFKLGKVKEN